VHAYSDRVRATTLGQYRALLPHARLIDLTPNTLHVLVRPSKASTRAAGRFRRGRPAPTPPSRQSTALSSLPTTPRRWRSAIRAWRCARPARKGSRTSPRSTATCQLAAPPSSPVRYKSEVVRIHSFLFGDISILLGNRIATGALDVLTG